MNMAVLDLGAGKFDASASLFPLDLSGQLVVLRACIDAGKSPSGVFSVAGVAFGYAGARKANQKWSRLMNGRTFHMTDFSAREGDFKGIERDEVDKIMKGIVGILRQHAVYFVSVSCDADLIGGNLPIAASRDRESEEMRNAFRSPYGVMCHLCMYALGRFARQKNEQDRSISYTLEKGDAGQDGLIRFMRYIEDSPNSETLLNGYSYSRLTTTAKTEMEGVFHSADFLAWEWAREVTRHKSGKKMRKSLSVLTGMEKSESDYFGVTLSDKSRFLMRHYDERNIDRFALFLRQAVGASTREQLDQAISGWEVTR